MQVSWQPLGHPPAVEVLKQRDRHPAGGAQGLPRLRHREGLRQPREDRGRPLVGAGREDNLISDPKQQPAAGRRRERLAVKAELA